MRYSLPLACAAAILFIATASATIDRSAVSIPTGPVAREIDRWERINLRPSQRNASQIIAIQTKGPSLQGLIRIPGGIASNFDTGKGMTVIDLINVGSKANGYVDVVALVLFTQSMPNQSLQVFTVDCVK